ncbi:MAG: hypothetical protein ACI9XK_002683, partial [Granulosicoccus sp.]
WASPADTQPIFNWHATRLEHVYFLEQRLWGDDDTVANDTGYLLTQNAARDKVEDRFFIAYHQGMAGIMPTLETNDQRGLFSQYIDNLAFALVTPLGAKHEHTVCHTICISVFY